MEMDHDTIDPDAVTEGGAEVEDASFAEEVDLIVLTMVPDHSHCYLNNNSSNSSSRLNHNNEDGIMEEEDDRIFTIDHSKRREEDGEGN